MSDIFISYRREDAADVTGRINDHFCNTFGQEKIFTDVDNIPLGVDFREHIDQEVSHCEILIAVIGPEWLGITNEQGERRLDDSGDFVRLEIESALKRNIPVIPVLVRRATMPSEVQLPDSIKPLAFRNATPVRPDPDFRNDINRLIKGIQSHLSTPESLSLSSYYERLHLAKNQTELERLQRELEQLAKTQTDDLELKELQQKVVRAIASFEQVAPASVVPSTSSSEQAKRSNFPLRYAFAALVIVAVGIGIVPVINSGPDSGPNNDVTVSDGNDTEINTPVNQTDNVFKPGDEFQDTLEMGGKAPEMVIIPAGSFMMGSPASGKGRRIFEDPQHPVQIDSFALGKTEVTFDEYDAFAQATGRELPQDKGWGRGKRPVINVSWTDAVAYAQWLSEQTGNRYRLPTEAEWEYAARGGTTTAYPWGEEASHDYANYGMDKCCEGLAIGQDKWVNTAPVASFPANKFGLHDMQGNVWEWTQDCWHASYDGAPADGRAWLEQGKGDCGLRVVRGGGWYDTPGILRSASRDGSTAGDAGSGQGFRLARDL